MELRRGHQGLKLRCASGSSVHLPAADPRRTPESSMHFSNFDAPGNRFPGEKWSPPALKFAKCIGFLQAHQRSPSARRFAKRIAALLVHRRSSRAPMIVKRTYITFFHPTFRVLTTLFHHVIGCFTTFFHPIFDRVATLFQHSFSLLDCVFHLEFASAGCVFQHTHERPRRK